MTKVLKQTTRGNVHVRLIFDPADCWIGVYWDPHMELGRRVYDVYITIIPMFPIRIMVRK
jgi:hypothetical protein